MSEGSRVFPDDQFCAWILQVLINAGMIEPADDNFESFLVHDSSRDTPIVLTRAQVRQVVLLLRVELPPYTLSWAEHYGQQNQTQMWETIQDCFLISLHYLNYT